MGIYKECWEKCAKEHSGFHPIDQQRCVTKCMDVPVTTGMIPFIPGPEREFYIESQPLPKPVEAVKEAVEGLGDLDLEDILIKTVVTAGVIGAGLVVLNAASKGVGRGVSEGLIKKIGD